MPDPAFTRIESERLVIRRFEPADAEATEAVGRLVTYAFDTLGMHRLHAFTNVRNASARALFERLGFRREGELTESFWSKGHWTSEYLYATLRAERASRRAT